MPKNLSRKKKDKGWREKLKRFLPNCDKVIPRGKHCRDDGTWLAKHVPCLHALVFSAPRDYKLLKATWGLIFGGLVTTMLYYMVVSRLTFDPVVKWTIMVILGFPITFGCMASVQVRCLCVLIIPTFFGKAGRSYIGAIGLALLLAGPITSIVANAGETTRALYCATELSSNLATERLKLRTQPMVDVMKDLKDQSKTIKEKMNKVKEEFNPVEKEVEDDSEVNAQREKTKLVDSYDEKDSDRAGQIDKKRQGNDTLNKYEKKLDYRCEDIYNIGVEKCRQHFREKEADCRVKWPRWRGNIVCLPLKLGVICELAKLIPHLTGVNCDSTEGVNQGFEGSFDTAEKAANAMNKNFEVEMRYKLVEGEDDLNYQTAADTSKAIKYEMEWRKRWFGYIIEMVKVFTAFLFIRILFNAHKYQQKYLTDLASDNTYATSYFEKIDSRRKKQAKSSLLPLKKVERERVQNPTEFRMMPSEKKKLNSSIVRTIFRMFTYGVVIFIDWFICDILKIIRAHSQIEFTQTGEHNIEIVVQGTGPISEVIRGLLRGLNSKHELHQVEGNLKCLPKPLQTEYTILLQIAGVFAFLLFLLFCETYTLRIRHLIAAFFYRKREKRRILHLYNDMLKKRYSFLHYTRKQVIKKIRKNKLKVKASIIVGLYTNYRSCCGWLKPYVKQKKTCLVCDEKESKALPLYECDITTCPFAFCGQCWEDIDKKCLVCNVDDFSISSEGSAIGQSNA